MSFYNKASFSELTGDIALTDTIIVTHNTNNKLTSRTVQLSNLWKDLFFLDASYGSENHILSIQFRDDQPSNLITIDIGDLVDTYTGDNVTISVNNNTFSVKDLSSDKITSMYGYDGVNLNDDDELSVLSSDSLNKAMKKLETKISNLDDDIGDINNYTIDGDTISSDTDGNISVTNAIFGLASGQDFNIESLEDSTIYSSDNLTTIIKKLMKQIQESENKIMPIADFENAYKILPREESEEVVQSQIWDPVSLTADGWILVTPNTNNISQSGCGRININSSNDGPCFDIKYGISVPYIFPSGINISIGYTSTDGTQYSGIPGEVWFIPLKK